MKHNRQKNSRGQAIPGFLFISRTAVIRALKRLGRAYIIACCGLFLISSPLSARILVDLELVLAVDTSSSVDAREYQLQMEGLIRAFQDPAVIAAIHGTGTAGIAVTVVHWSSSGEQSQIVPWTRIWNQASAHYFSRLISKHRNRPLNGSTGIGDALLFAKRLFRRNAFEGRRKSIDISGDGINNSGIPPGLVREAVITSGVTINGLAILNEYVNLRRYFARNVIGGAGAFVMTANSYADIIAAMQIKLLREISVSVADAKPAESLTTQ